MCLPWEHRVKRHKFQFNVSLCDSFPVRAIGCFPHVKHCESTKGLWSCESDIVICSPRLTLLSLACQVSDVTPNSLPLKVFQEAVATCSFSAFNLSSHEKHKFCSQFQVQREVHSTVSSHAEVTFKNYQESFCYYRHLYSVTLHIRSVALLSTVMQNNVWGTLSNNEFREYEYYENNSSGKTRIFISSTKLCMSTICTRRYFHIESCYNISEQPATSSPRNVCNHPLSYCIAYGHNLKVHHGVISNFTRSELKATLKIFPTIPEMLHCK